MVPVSRAPQAGQSQDVRRADPALRAAHLLRIDGYLDIAMMAMWAAAERGPLMLGMADASLRHPGPDERDDETLDLVRTLFGEAREYHSEEDFPAMMCRMRVAGDLLSLRIIELSGERPEAAADGDGG